jgi:hypothetical protein
MQLAQFAKILFSTYRLLNDLLTWRLQQTLVENMHFDSDAGFPIYLSNSADPNGIRNKRASPSEDRYSSTAIRAPGKVL